MVSYYITIIILITIHPARAMRVRLAVRLVISYEKKLANISTNPSFPHIILPMIDAIKRLMRITPKVSRSFVVRGSSFFSGVIFFNYLTAFFGRPIFFVITRVFR